MRQADSEIERWKVQGAAGSHPAGAWEDVLAETHVAFDVRLTERAPDVFHGVVVRRQLGQVALVDCASTPFVGRGGTAVIGQPLGDIVGLQWVRRGVEQVGIRDPLTLTRGSTIAWDGSQSTDIEVVEPFVKRTLILPRARILAHCPQLEDLGAIVLRGENATARLLARYLAALIAEFPTLERSEMDVVSETMVELACSAIQPGLPSSRTARRTALRETVRRFIRENLQDSRLDPQTVAHAHSISVRTLHALFEESDTSVAGLIRRERLNAALTDLQSRGGGSVTEIAFRWGFVDSAHFSRAFKKQFGMTPRDARNAGRTEREAQNLSAAVPRIPDGATAALSGKKRGAEWQDRRQFSWIGWPT